MDKTGSLRTKIPYRTGVAIGVATIISFLALAPMAAEAHVVNCGYTVNQTYAECIVQCNVHMVNDIRNGRLTGCCQYVNKCLVIWP